MCRPTTIRFRASLLLAVMAVWFVSGTLCCQAAVAHVESSAPSCHGHAAKHTGAPDRAHPADGACCVGDRVFPAPVDTVELTGGSDAGVPILFLTWADDHLPVPAAQVVRASDTGPPERSSFAELVLQRSLPARAPPAVA